MEKFDGTDKNLVLLNTFLIEKKRYRVFYNSGLLIWEKEKSKKGKHTIPITDVVNVKTTIPKSTNNQQVFPIPTTNNNSNVQNNGSSMQNMQNEQRNYGAETINDNNSHLQYKTLTINYVKRLYNPKSKAMSQSNDPKHVNKWRMYSITLHNSDKRVIKVWYDTLTAILKSFNRPKKLLLFVNPYGGKRNALKLYEKYGKPLFKVADIDISLIVSQRSNQIFDLVIQQHIDQFDGIICCGGDGTFSELFNGLIYRKLLTEQNQTTTSKTKRDIVIDVNNIPKPDKPIGVIPAGSTDTVAYCLHGTTDIKTCIIHIILGQTTGLDISSVSNNSGLIKFFASTMSYGYLGDVAYESEKFRWMGPKRYDYSGFKKFLKNKGYDAEVSLLQDVPSDGKVPDPDDGDKCYENCQTCSSSSDACKSDDDNNAGLNADNWKIVKGKFFMINGANISCACKRSPLGFSPFCHIGDGYLDVILVRHTNFINNLKLLLTMSSANRKISDLTFVDVYRTKKFYFKSLNADGSDSLNDFNSSTQPIRVNSGNMSSFWNCDGEVLQETDIIVRSHNQLVTVYRRGATREFDDEASVLSTSNSSFNCLCCCF